MEVKDLLNTLGITEDIRDVSEFKKIIEDKFVPVSEIAERKELIEPIVNKAIGKRIGSIETLLKKTAKEHGIDIEGGELKDKPIEEVTKHLFGKLTDAHTSVVKDLKTQLDGKSDEVFKKLQKEIEEYKTKYSEVENLLNDTKNQFTKLQSDKENEIKSFKIEVKKKSIFDTIGFKKDMSAVEKTGFETLLNSKYALDLDGDEIVVKDKSGKRIKNDKVVGAFKTFEEVLKEEAEANGLISKNPHGGKPAFVAATTTTTTTTEPAKNQMTFHPKFARR
jgi:hypothetical protein